LSKKVNIGQAQYTLSQQGDGKGWGESESDLIEAIVDAINGFFGPGDILPTAQSIVNAVGVLGSIDGSTGSGLIDGTGTDNDSYECTISGSYDYSLLTDGSNIINLTAGQFLVYSSGAWAKSQTPADAGYIIIPFFQFDGATVSFFETEYTVIRQFTGSTGIIFESGKILGQLDPNGTWSINQQRHGDLEAGIFFGINANGQMTYATTKMEGAVYDAASSKITFKAKSIIK